MDEEPARTRRRRALEEPLDVRWDDRSWVVAADVRNLRHRTHYRVYFPAYPDEALALCTCPDFALRGLGTCKHVESVRFALEDLHSSPPVTGPPPSVVRKLWSEIDRRIRVGASADPVTVGVRYPGRALFDPGVG